MPVERFTRIANPHRNIYMEVYNQRKGAIMATTTQNTNRTTHLLALMKKGDDAFNSRDVEGMDAVHHPDIIAHVSRLTAT